MTIVAITTPNCWLGALPCNQLTVQFVAIAKIAEPSAAVAAAEALLWQKPWHWIPNAGVWFAAVNCRHCQQYCAKCWWNIFNIKYFDTDNETVDRTGPSFITVLYQKSSPLTKDLTEDGDGRGTAHALSWWPGPPGAGTSPCSAPQTPAASGYNSRPAPGAWRPPPRRSPRQTRGRRPRPVSQGRASPSTGHRHRWGWEEPGGESKITSEVNPRALI